MAARSKREERRRKAHYAVRSGTAVRDALSMHEVDSLFGAITVPDKARSNGIKFGVTELSCKELDELYASPESLRWEPECTLLCYAAWMQRIQNVKHLLAAGANPAIRYEAPGEATPATVDPRPYLFGLVSGESAWVVCTVVRMRLAGMLAAKEERGKLGEGSPLPCLCCCEDLVQPLLWVSCGHLSCEPCAWRHLLESESLECPSCRVKAPPEVKAIRQPKEARLKPIKMDLEELKAKGHPEDWTCQACAYRNFATRGSCRSCGTGKGQSFAVSSSEDPLEGEERRGGAISKAESLSLWQSLPEGLDDAFVPHEEQAEDAPEESEQQVQTAREVVPRKGQKRAGLLNPLEAAALAPGETQAARSVEWFKAASLGQWLRLSALFRAGIDLDLQNDYGQTALAIALWLGHERCVEGLMGLDADRAIEAHGGVNTIHEYNGTEAAELHVLIPNAALHPGAGAFMVDSGFDEPFLEELEKLYGHLPNGLKGEPKGSDLCIERRYYCDAVGVIMRHIKGLLKPLVDRGFEPMPQMRFLRYFEVGGSLPPHVDLARTDNRGRRSTHTFILYLDGCREGAEGGGETVLLHEAKGEEEWARVAPKRGRLLVFPHMTPHMAREVTRIPKLLLRGELRPCGTSGAGC